MQLWSLVIADLPLLPDNLNISSVFPFSISDLSTSSSTQDFKPQENVRIWPILKLILNNLCLQLNIVLYNPLCGSANIDRKREKMILSRLKSYSNRSVSYHESTVRSLISYHFCDDEAGKIININNEDTIYQKSSHELSTFDSSNQVKVDFQPSDESDINKGEGNHSNDTTDFKLNEDKMTALIYSVLNVTLPILVLSLHSSYLTLNMQTLYSNLQNQCRSVQIHLPITIQNFFHHLKHKKKKANQSNNSNESINESSEIKTEDLYYETESNLNSKFNSNTNKNESDTITTVVEAVYSIYRCVNDAKLNEDYALVLLKLLDLLRQSKKLIE